VEETGAARQGAQTTFQIKSLAGAMTRGEYERAQQMLENASNLNVPAPLQGEWAELVARLEQVLKTAVEDELKKWRADVDQLAAETKKAILEAKSSADLDSFVVRCTALQMRPGPKVGLLRERSSRKMEGVVEALSVWPVYFDHRDAGKDKLANAALRTLLTSTRGVPLFTTEEVNAHLLPDPTDPTVPRPAMAKLYQTVRSPADLTALMEKIRRSRSMGGLEFPRSDENLRLMEILLEAWTAASKDDDEGANKAMEQYNFGEMNMETKRGLDLVVLQIVELQVQRKAPSWTKLPRNPDEDVRAYLNRILDDLMATGNFAKLLEVVKFADVSLRALQRMTTFARDRSALEEYLAAQRFESAGDLLGAASHYRLVIGTTGFGKYTPMAQAQAALKQIREKHPEAFKSYEGVLLEEVRSLRQQIQQMLIRQTTGRQY
jgi:hypothetical protein